MKLLILLSALYATGGFAQIADTGTTPLGPDTLGQPTYPNSGLLRSRPENISLAKPVPSEDPEMKAKNQRQEQQEIETGPYKNGEYQFVEKEDRDAE